jgi:hypothetical protein
MTQTPVGKEVGDGGLEHLQGYLTLDHVTPLWGIRRTISQKAHSEKAVASTQKNYEDCSKHGNVIFSKGFDRNQKRKEQEEYWGTVIKDAMTMGIEEFIQAHPKEWRIRRTQIEKLMLDAARTRMRVWNGNLQEKNYWIWGEAG